MRSDLEVSFRRRGIYRKLEETGKSPVSSLYFYLFRLSRLLPVFVGGRYSLKALCGSTMRWKTSLRFVIRTLFPAVFVRTKGWGVNN